MKLKELEQGTYGKSHVISRDIFGSINTWQKANLAQKDFWNFRFLDFENYVTNSGNSRVKNYLVSETGWRMRRLILASALTHLVSGIESWTTENITCAMDPSVRFILFQKIDRSLFETTKFPFISLLTKKAWSLNSQMMSLHFSFSLLSTRFCWSLNHSLTVSADWLRIASLLKRFAPPSSDFLDQSLTSSLS